MGLTINNNIPSLNANRQAGIAAKGLKKETEGLASGLRINRAADDAAGLAISEQFRTRIRQYSQEINNLQTGANAVETADQAIGTQQEALGRIQELATQAANGTLSEDQRAALNKEAQQLIQQINETAQNTEFNGLKILNGSAANVQLGTESGNQVTFNATTPAALGISGIDLGTQAGAASALETLGNAAEQLGQNRAALGAQANGITSAIETKQTINVNFQESESMIRDQDIARGMMERTRNELMLKRSTSALVQGNIIPQSAAQLLAT